METLFQESKRLDKAAFVFTNVKLRDKRCYYVANRVVGSQIVLLLLSGILSLLVIQTGILETMVMFWYVFIFIIPICGIIITYKKRKAFYYNRRWIAAFFPLAIIWFSFTVYFGAVMDFLIGVGRTFVIGVFLSLYYIIGYGVARSIRSIRFNFNKSSILWAFFLSSLILIIGTLIIGWIILESSMRANQIKHLYEYKEFHNCYMCVLGLYIMLSGLGIFLSALLNYWMLNLLYENPSSNVEMDSPNGLYLYYLTFTLIWMILFWIILEILIPFASSKKSSNSRSHSRPNTVFGGKKEAAVATAQKKGRVNQAWDSHHMGPPSEEKEKIRGVF